MLLEVLSQISTTVGGFLTMWGPLMLTIGGILALLAGVAILVTRGIGIAAARRIKMEQT